MALWHTVPLALVAKLVTKLLEGLIARRPRLSRILLFFVAILIHGSGFVGCVDFDAHRNNGWLHFGDEVGKTTPILVLAAVGGLVAGYVLARLYLVASAF